MPTQKLKDEVFWITVINESEIEKLAFSIYGEVQKSVRAIPSTIELPSVSNLLPEILKAIDRGVKIKLLITPPYDFYSCFYNTGREGLRQNKKAMEIRIAHNIASSFSVIDDSIVVLSQLHPMDKDRILSIV